MATIRKRKNRYQVQIRIKNYSASKTFSSLQSARFWSSAEESRILKEGNIYQWWVTAKDRGGNQMAATNSPFTFSVNASGGPNAAYKPAKPVLTYPTLNGGERVTIAHNGTSGQRPWLVWSDSGSLTSYEATSTTIMWGNIGG